MLRMEDCMPSWYRTATSSIRLRTVHTKGWDGTYAWAVKEGNTSAAVTIAAADPIHPNNPHYAVLEARPGVTLQNDGFDGISLKKGEKYDFSLFARVAPGSKGRQGGCLPARPDGP